MEHWSNQEQPIDFALLMRRYRAGEFDPQQSVDHDDYWRERRHEEQIAASQRQDSEIRRAERSYYRIGGRW